MVIQKQLTDADLERLEALLSKATPGPWRPRAVDDGVAAVETADGNDVVPVCYMREADARFISWMSTYASALLTEIRAMRQDREDLLERQRVALDEQWKRIGASQGKADRQMEQTYVAVTAENDRLRVEIRAAEESERTLGEALADLLQWTKIVAELERLNKGIGIVTPASKRILVARAALIAYRVRHKEEKTT